MISSNGTMMDKCWVCLDLRGLIYVSEKQVGASYSGPRHIAVGAYQCPTRPLDSPRNHHSCFFQMNVDETQ